MQELSVQSQLDMFRNAKVIFGKVLVESSDMTHTLTLGPHGAALTNMMWIQNRATVIEFPLTNMQNRNLGMLATICEHDYWILTEISSDYYESYEATPDNVNALVELLTHVLSEKMLVDLIKRQ